MQYAIKVDPEERVSLDHVPTKGPGSIDKDQGQERLAAFTKELTELQEWMDAAKQTAILAVFQGRDTAGKDGAINRILSYVNVQGCQVASFKVPTPEELSHDFLWRVHNQTPGLGGITLFNRSHYEDVLVVRVHDIVPKAVWEKRYDHINAFEKLLTDSGVIVLKFYLHISKDEQEQRLLDREQDPAKAWKLAVNDWKERDHWDAYTKAYEAALERCSPEHAPWHIIPSDQKWFRDLAIAEVLADAMRPCLPQWKERLEVIGSKAKAELQAYRQASRPLG